MLDLEVLQDLVEAPFPELNVMVHMNGCDDKYCVAVMVSGLPQPVACCFTSVGLTQLVEDGANANEEVARVFVAILRKHHNPILWNLMYPCSPN